MRSSFFELGVAVSGLNSSRAGMEVISHNLANASSKEYSRQYIKQRAATPLTYQDGKGMIGTGSFVYEIDQKRNRYLDEKYWQENSILGEFETKDAKLKAIEGVFNELSDSGLKANFDDFFLKLQNLKTSPADDVYRTNVIQTAQSLAKFINNTGQNLKKHQQEINSEINTIITIVNSLGKQIKNLNIQISKFEADGSNANDLRDQRAKLTDDLSKYLNIQVKESTDKKYQISINGYQFVDNFENKTLKLTQRPIKLNDMDVEGLYDIGFEDSSSVNFNMFSSTLKGELKALVDIRDGEDVNLKYKGIPYYMQKLNRLVRVFARAINEGKDSQSNDIEGVIGHIYGYDKDGNNGNLFFSYDPNIIKDDPNTNLDDIDYDLFTFENLQISTYLTNNVSKLSSAQDDISDPDDNRVILGFININNHRSLFKEGKLSDFIVGTSSQIAIDLRQANKFYENYTDIMTSLQNQRDYVKGVDINEEMVSLVQFNQVYQSVAKLINIIDGVYDTCINRLGL